MLDYLQLFFFFKANKKLKLENGGLVRENLRLKAELDNRSPQKYVFCSQSNVSDYVSVLE